MNQNTSSSRSGGEEGSSGTGKRMPTHDLSALTPEQFQQWQALVMNGMNTSNAINGAGGAGAGGSGSTAATGPTTTTTTTSQNQSSLTAAAAAAAAMMMARVPPQSNFQQLPPYAMTASTAPPSISSHNEQLLSLLVQQQIGQTQGQLTPSLAAAPPSSNSHATNPTVPNPYNNSNQNTALSAAIQSILAPQQQQQSPTLEQLLQPKPQAVAPPAPDTPTNNPQADWSSVLRALGLPQPPAAPPPPVAPTSYQGNLLQTLQQLMGINSLSGGNGQSQGPNSTGAFQFPQNNAASQQQQPQHYSANNSCSSDLLRTLAVLFPGISPQQQQQQQQSLLPQQQLNGNSLPPTSVSFPTNHSTAMQSPLATATTAQTPSSLLLSHTAAAEAAAEANVTSSSTGPPVTSPTLMSRPKKRGRISTFPQKLHSMLMDLEKQGRQDIASFVYDGRAFMIHDAERFVRDVIPTYFKMTTLSSFQRQLNLYDFHRIHDGPHHGAYFHSLFVKDYGALANKMVRNKVIRKDTKAARKAATAEAAVAAASAAENGVRRAKNEEVCQKPDDPANQTFFPSSSYVQNKDRTTKLNSEILGVAQSNQQEICDSLSSDSREDDERDESDGDSHHDSIHSDEEEQVAAQLAAMANAKNTVTIAASTTPIELANNTIPVESATTDNEKSREKPSSVESDLTDNFSRDRAME